MAKTKRKLYNKELKQRFLSQYRSSTADSYESVLSQCYDTEKFLNKDVCQFTHDEYASLLYNFEAKSLSSLTSKNSTIKRYIEFCIKEGYVPSRLNVAENFDRATLRQFIRKDALKYKFISSKELDDVIEKCINAQDAVIFQLLREGVKGEGSEELINLTINDVDEENNILTLRSDNNVREHKVSDKTIELIKEAYKQKYYYPKNGETQNEKIKQYYLPDSPYIIKMTGKKRKGRASRQIVQRRVKFIAEWWGNPFLTPSNVWTSGQIEYAKQIKTKKGVDRLEPDDYREICRRFGLSEHQWERVKSDIQMYI